jgi:hypothetical protein
MEKTSLELPSQQALPAPARPREASPESRWIGGCLKGVSITLGLLSLALSVLAITVHLIVLPTTHPYEALGLALIYVFGWVVCLIAGVISCFCAGFYAALSPSERGSAWMPLLIGGLALGLDIVAFVIYKNT